ncbi:MAG: hypothetical protein KDD40_05020 [Bdellovibrionales bacterium]|nr:hypothetical protein [Bdellovibrionales bacterium]
MTNTKWVPLTEYSNKYQVSISTLRRRIRSNRVECIYEDGKYLLKDLALKDHRPNSDREGKIVSAPPQPPNTSLPNSHLGSSQELLQPPSAQPVSPPPKTMRPVEAQPEKTMDCTAHLTYLNEIKKAYSLILQEKEEQALILKDEVADLQTLVKVLESENQRLKLENKKWRESYQAESRKTEMSAESFLQNNEWNTDLEIE